MFSYNEPDGSTSTGGSDITPTAAAANWKAQLEPLRALGVKLGAPAVTGSPDGFTWLTSFFTACGGGCTPDFMTVHWYGNFEGLQSNIEQKRKQYVYYFLLFQVLFFSKNICTVQRLLSTWKNN